MYADLVFDIVGDSLARKHLTKTQRESQKLLHFIEDRGFKVKYIAFSGSKGFHVVCQDPFDIQAVSPLEREEIAKKVRKTLVEEIIDSSSNRGFKVISPNPVLLNLSLNECSNLTWVVNATFNQDTSEEFFTYASLVEEVNINAMSQMFNISINNGSVESNELNISFVSPTPLNNTVTDEIQTLIL